MIFIEVLLQLSIMLFDASIYQQNRYHQDRYLQTLSPSTIQMACSMSLGYGFYILLCLNLNNSLIVLLSHSILLYLICKIYFNHQAHYPLKWTKRMMRCFLFASLFLILFFYFLSYLSFLNFIIKALLFGFHFFAFYAWIKLIDPLEKAIKKKIASQAKKKLQQMNCQVIGITGSYGKTSVKNILNEVLSHNYATMATPFSYNNEMGISRTIFDYLNHSHEIFLCEMGADHLHEIEDLCQMVQPVMGLVISVGPQHLSTFKTIENILHEKMQLIEALPSHGIGFLNVDNHWIREYPYEFACKIVTIGIHESADIQASQIQYTATGSHFHVVAFGREMDCTIQLLGEQNIMNCLFAIGVALSLKITPEVLIEALKICPCVPHRLELKPFYEATLIDNAYNSNPESAYQALQVLAQMPNSHLLITPGFIDLGEHHDYYSYEFGTQMVGICDKVILVGKNEMIKKGLLAHDFCEDNLYEVALMSQALQLASVLIQEGDTVLIENDIPISLAPH